MSRASTWPFMAASVHREAVDPLDAEKARLLDEMDEAESGSPYCECNDNPSMEESDWNQCDACGKPFA